jgi:MoaA/NifB/PqqE/SkfB family radical SAM enzyme
VSETPRESPAHLKKGRLLKSFVLGRFISCTWQLTRNCEAQCLYCEQRLELGDGGLSLEACAEVIRRLDGMGSLVVDLCGGEPLMHADVVEIVRGLARNHLPRLTTNGGLATPEKARALWQAGLRAASVRIHDSDAARHDERAGAAGAHARAVTALRAFIDTRPSDAQRVDLVVPLDMSDISAVERVLLMAAPLGVSVVVEPPLAGEVTAPASQASRALLKLKQMHPHLRSSAGFLGRLDEALRDGIAGCRAGRIAFNIDHRGRVSRCIERQALGDSMGDAMREDMNAILEKLRRLAVQDPCRACWRSSRGEIELLYTLPGMLGAIPRMIRI